MFEDKRVLAVIPARGGSKGLPNKNILLCAGRPLIEWTISAARSVDFIDDVVVSSDSKEIADIAQAAGALVPFKRPDNLATDNASIVDVLNHAWKTAGDYCGRAHDFVVLLQPTSPLRNSGHINSAINFYFKNRLSESDGLASVFSVGKKYGWLMQSSPLDAPYLKFCISNLSNNLQRQKLGDYFLPNGAIFIVRGCDIPLGLYKPNTIPFIMEKDDSIDIDTFDDFQKAETILRERQAK